MKHVIHITLSRSVNLSFRFAISLVFVLSVLVVKSQSYYTFSYTYQNISKINGGGTIETGDTIEIRALMKVDRKATNVYYRDTIRHGFQLVPNSMKLVTNEGLLFRGTYTNIDNDDHAVVRTNGGITRFRVNIGTGAQIARFTNFDNLTGGGTVNPGDKPKFYGTTLFVVAYRLVVTAGFGEIVYPTGTFYYRDYNNVSHVQHFSYPGIKVLPNEGLCQNLSGASFTAESDFGQGTLQNRIIGVNAPGYVKFNLTPNNPVDGQYSVANNTSGDGSTNNSVPYPNNSRVFGVWDIVGDHTDAADPEVGNPPASPGSNGGYMLVVNSAYPTGDAYSDVISGLCPNTNYEFSAWIRNICGYCGIDSNSVSTNTPGVLPNLAFTINDIDHYTTGEIQWTGKWVKRGFLYKTGPNETSFKITIKNNAAGGGGNDWVLDDIKLATCYPDLIMNPNEQVEVCVGGTLHLRDTVRSYFDNYNYYCWEKSTDGGATWASVGNCGQKTPEFKNGMWEYVIDTAFVAVAADSGAYLRVKVATSIDNLNNDNCVVQDAQKLLLKVGSSPCDVVATVLKGVKVNNMGRGRRISWTSLQEPHIQSFEVQKSTDGNAFKTIGIVEPGQPPAGNYYFDDTQSASGSLFYRIKIVAAGDVLGYSSVVSVVVPATPFQVSAVNPFTNHIAIDFYSTGKGMVELYLFDAHGRQLRKDRREVFGGVSKLLLHEVSGLTSGLYILKAVMNGVTVQQTLIKK